MARLTAKQRRYLRGLAHPLTPLVHVGKGLLSNEIVGQIDRALAVHELIKVRFLGGKEAKAEMIPEICTRTGAEEAGRVGHVVILFRAQPEEEKRRIRLDE